MCVEGARVIKPTRKSEQPHRIGATAAIIIIIANKMSNKYQQQLYQQQQQQAQANKRARTARPAYLEARDYWAARSAAYNSVWPVGRRPPRYDDDDDFYHSAASPRGGWSGGDDPRRYPLSYQQQQYAAPIECAAAAAGAGASACRSPYSLNPNPTRVWIMHSTQARGVHGLDYGPVGAPFPEHRVVVGAETGTYDSDGAFVPDPWFPRKVLVRVGRWARVVGFEVGPLGEAYPLRAVAVFCWGKIQVGKIVIGDVTGTGDATPELVVLTEEPVERFAGLTEADLDPDQFAEPVSAAVWTALAGVRQRCETINNGGRMVGVPNNTPTAAAAAAAK